MSRYRGVVLSQFEVQSYPQAVSRLYYKPKADAFTCCIVQRGRHVPDTEMALSRDGAHAHYEAAAENGRCYRAFPEEEHHGHDES